MNLIGAFQKFLRNVLCESKDMESRDYKDCLSEYTEGFCNCDEFHDRNDPYDIRNPVNINNSYAFDHLYCNIHYRRPDEK